MANGEFVIYQWIHMLISNQLWNIVPIWLKISVFFRFMENVALYAQVINYSSEKIFCKFYKATKNYLAIATEILN